MKVYRYIRAMLFGIGLIVVVLTSGGFHSTWQWVTGTLGFVAGLGLNVLAVRAMLRDYRRHRMELTPVPEADDSGMGFLRREREERLRAEAEERARRQAQ